jgi:hypothetical protein
MAKGKAAPKASTATALDMTARPAKYVNINTRHEKHGKDAVQLCADISLRGFHIDEHELNHLLGTKAFNALFVAANGKGKPAEPMFRNVDPLRVWDEFEGCDVHLSLGLSDNAVTFEDAFVSKIVLDPQVGGLSLMNCMVSVEVEDTDDVARLLEHMGDECRVSIYLGAKHVPKDAKAQTSLDIGPTSATSPSSDAEQPAATH